MGAALPAWCADQEHFDQVEGAAGLGGGPFGGDEVQGPPARAGSRTPAKDIAEAIMGGSGNRMFAPSWLNTFGTGLGEEVLNMMSQLVSARRRGAATASAGLEEPEEEEDEGHE